VESNCDPCEDLCPLLPVGHLTAETGAKWCAPFGAEERDVGSSSAQSAYDSLISCSARCTVQGSEDLRQNMERQIQAARLRS
jgi:hypothetical protein